MHLRLVLEQQKGYMVTVVTVTDVTTDVTFSSFLTFLPPVPMALCTCFDDTLPP